MKLIYSNKNNNTDFVATLRKLRLITNHGNEYLILRYPSGKIRKVKITNDTYKLQ